MSAAGRGCTGRFMAWEVPSGWTVVDLREEAVALPRMRWDAETAAMVAATLAAYPKYAVEWDWSGAASGREVAP